MNLYTHLLLASRLESHLQPADPPDYLWGAVCADIRYLAGLPRDRTHLSPAQIDVYQCAYPELESFLRGYRVHCLLDEINLEHVLGRRFPLRLFRLRQRHLAVMVELDAIRSLPGAFVLSGRHNPVLADLGISAGQASDFAGLLHQYLASPSMRSVLNALRQFGLLDDARVQEYLRAATAFGRNWLLQRIFSSVIRRAGLERAAVEYVLSAWDAPTIASGGDPA